MRIRGAFIVRACVDQPNYPQGGKHNLGITLHYFPANPGTREVWNDLTEEERAAEATAILKSVDAWASDWHDPRQYPRAFCQHRQELFRDTLMNWGDVSLDRIEPPLYATYLIAKVCNKCRVAAGLPGIGGRKVAVKDHIKGLGKPWLRKGASE